MTFPEAARDPLPDGIPSCSFVTRAIELSLCLFASGPSRQPARIYAGVSFQSLTIGDIGSP